MQDDVTAAREMDALQLAKLFHDTYERLAPQFGYETREETKQFDSLAPNGQLMVATCAQILAAIRAMGK